MNAVVTCLFDLASLPGNDCGRRSLSEYLEHASRLLKLNVPMFVFTSPDLEEVLRSMRPERAESIFVVSRYLDVWNSLQITCGAPERFREAFHGHRGRVNPVKDTPEYMTLITSKMSFMHKAANQRSSSDRLIWVDVGLSHVVPDLARLKDIATRCPKTAVFGVVRPGLPAPQDVGTIHRFIGRACGGLWSLPVGDVPRWRELAATETISHLKRGGYPFECDVFYSLLMKGGLTCDEDGMIRCPEDHEALPPCVVYDPGEDNYSRAVSDFPLEASWACMSTS